MSHFSKRMAGSQMEAVVLRVFGQHGVRNFGPLSDEQLATVSAVLRHELMLSGANDGDLAICLAAMVNAIGREPGIQDTDCQRITAVVCDVFRFDCAVNVSTDRTTDQYTLTPRLLH
jgi:hypothetical protein